jgi:hypothetical protein
MSHAMGDDAPEAPLDGRHHLGWRRPALDQTLEMRGRPPAQERAVTARKDSGEVKGFHAGRPMADPVDAAVLADEHPDVQPVPDFILADAAPQQLRPGDNAVRSRRDPRDHLLRCSI